MKASIEFICRRVVGHDIKNGEYEISDGSNVRDLVTCAAENAGVALPSDLYDRVMFLTDKRPSEADSPLHEGASIHMVQRIVGG